MILSSNRYRVIAAAAISISIHALVIGASLSNVGGRTASSPSPTPIVIMARLVESPAATAAPTPVLDIVPGPEKLPGINPSEDIEPKQIEPKKIEPQMVSPVSAAEPTVAPAPSNAITLEPGRPIKYYAFEEVDRPALPVADWDMPVESLAGLGLKRLVIELLIADDGELHSVNIVSSSPDVLKGRDRERVVRSMMRTKVSPALKDGKPVPSQRRLEIAFES